MEVEPKMSLDFGSAQTNHTFLELVPLPALIVERVGTDAPVAWANRAFTDLLGVEAEALVGNDIRDWSPDLPEAFGDDAIQLTDASGRFTVCRLTRGDGSTIWARLQTSTSLLHNHRYITAYVEDISPCR
ncbi:PAS domain S-box protein [Antrihabitans sp. YC2-6]|uniref:PAS domain S-box protein n=1 Tax=Antrihabitans sp. YC2-6 TaxID=2799498 RepID=UPI0018F58E81|nr:PAS domain S-box protein [Antrihabitans sp. YC2-6]MBJ8348965.1 PAS domain-containing protein [Antrihabitans sp. YC2-6]